MKAKEHIKPLPFAVYFISVAMISLVGLIDAVYLSISHYRVYTDIDHRSFCAISKAINCDTVSQSAYSIFLGVPVPVWGICGYLIVFLFLFYAWRCRGNTFKAFWPSIFIIALAYSLNSIALALVSSLMIHSHCIMCILSHAVNFGILFFAWLIHKRFNGTGILAGLKADVRRFRQSWRVWTATALVVAGTAIIMIALFPPYWQLQLKTLDTRLPQGVTAEGYPWIGAENPKVVIHEFSDYQCFQCRKMHLFLRQLVAKHPQRIRLVHHHFPMDENYNPLVKEPFHTGSGKMAILALYAQAKGQFWKINDFLFTLAARKEDFNTATIASEMNISSGEVAAALNNRYFRLQLKHEIAVGIELGITGTPGFLIEDQLYTGTIPQPVMERILPDHE